MPWLREFTHGDQQSFAELSGDWNPLHVDPVAARRLMPGRAVVHGIHLVLWAVEQALGLRGGAARLADLSGEFRKPVGVGERASLDVATFGDWDRCSIRCGAKLAAVLEFRWEDGESEAATAGQTPDEGPPRGVPAALGPEDLRAMQGLTRLCCDRDALRASFPRLAATGDWAAIADLLATTRVVGMLCPGLHSIFNRFSLQRTASQAAANSMRYEVLRFDDRFSLARIGVKGDALEGKLEAFLRPEPREQCGYADLGKLVIPGEFAAWKVLVVGGSRGLGEVSSKLLAAGGAEVAFTFRSGAEESARIQREIVEAGGNARAHRLDVSHPGTDIEAIAAAHGGFTHLLYFATGPIFVAERGAFDPQLFRRFCEIYVTGFAFVVERLAPFGLRRVLYPSSVALDELPADMGEYAAAKAAGETAGAYLAKVHRGLEIRSPRLPRLATDQTRSLVPVSEEAPERLLLPELRRLRLLTDGAPG